MADNSSIISGLINYGQPGYINPQFVNQAQIKALRDYGSQTMQPMPVHRWTEGLANVVKALVGGNAMYQANEMSQNAGQAASDAAKGLYSGSVGNPAASPTSNQPSGGPPPQGVPPQPSAPPVTTTPPPSPASSPAGNIAPSDVQTYIASAAKARGINPDTAMRVAASEGGFTPTRAGDSNSSFGPFQLHYGGVASGGNSAAGLGDDFTKATGLDARDPANWKATVDFALDNAAKNGWGAFHGAQRAGIGEREGIGGNQAAPAPNGMTADQYAAIVSNPNLPDAAKKAATDLISPHFVQDGLNNTYRMLPMAGSQPAEVLRGGTVTQFSTPGYSGSAITTGNPGQTNTQFLVPPGADGHPLSGAQKVIDDGIKNRAKETAATADAANLTNQLNAYGADGIRAKGTIGQLDAIDQQGQKAGYGAIANIKDVLGRYGIETNGLSDIQSYEKAIDAFAPNSPIAGQFKAALGGLLTTPAGRQAAVANMKLLAQYQQQVGEIANNRDIDPVERMNQIQALPQPQLALPQKAPSSGAAPSATAPQPQQSAPSGPVAVQTPDQARALPPGTHFRTPDGREFVR